MIVQSLRRSMKDKHDHFHEDVFEFTKERFIKFHPDKMRDVSETKKTREEN